MPSEENKERGDSKHEEGENEGEENSAGENTDGEEKKESSKGNQEGNKDDKKEADEGGGDGGCAGAGAVGPAPKAQATGTEHEAAGKSYHMLALIGIMAAIAGLAVLIIALLVLGHQESEADEKQSNTFNLTLFEVLSVGDYSED